MLLVPYHELHAHDLDPSSRTATPPRKPPFSILDCLNMPEQPPQDHQQMMHMAAHENTSASSTSASSDTDMVAQALEIARENPGDALDPAISNVLESALANIWARVQAQPESYVMSRDEFAIFNFFQHRFQGNKTAMEARKRYWDNLTVPS
jgi:hypothetical protein